MEDVELVGCRHGDGVFMRMPGGVQDLLVVVQTVYGDLILFPTSLRAHLTVKNMFVRNSGDTGSEGTVTAVSKEVKNDATRDTGGLKIVWLGKV